MGNERLGKEAVKTGDTVREEGERVSRKASRGWSETEME